MLREVDINIKLDALRTLKFNLPYYLLIIENIILLMKLPEHAPVLIKQIKLLQ